MGIMVRKCFPKNREQRLQNKEQGIVDLPKIMNQDQLEKCKSQIRASFKSGPPNGWLLGWEGNRFEEDIAAVAKPYKTLNMTNFDYGFCNTYRVLDETRNEYHRWELTIQISCIVDYFSTFWTKYSPGSSRVHDKHPDAETEKIQAAVKDWLRDKGLSEFPDEWYDLKMTDITLELSDPDKVTIAKCVFEDYCG